MVNGAELIHSPTFPSLHLRHRSFSNSSVALPMSQLILQPFHCFTYFTVHSPTHLSLFLHPGSSLTSPGEPPMTWCKQKKRGFPKHVTTTNSMIRSWPKCNFALGKNDISFLFHVTVTKYVYDWNNIFKFNRKIIDIHINTNISFHLTQNCNFQICVRYKHIFWNICQYFVYVWTGPTIKCGNGNIQDHSISLLLCKLHNIICSLYNVTCIKSWECCGNYKK